MTLTEYERLIDVLKRRGADKIEHSGESLLSHLRETASILEG